MVTVVRGSRRPPSRQASPRVLLLAGAAILTAAAVLVLGLTAFGSSKQPQVTKARGSLSGALPGAEDVHALFRNIHQAGNVLGSPTAPVTMVEYVDLQCPYCREFETTALPALVRRYVRTGTLKIEARPIAFIGPDSKRGLTAAIAAGSQGHMYDFLELLYFNQGAENGGWLDSQMIVDVAASIPTLEVASVLSASKSPVVADWAKRFEEDATHDRVDSTPTILIGPTGSRPTKVTLSSPADDGVIEAAIRRAQLSGQ